MQVGAPSICEKWGALGERGFMHVCLFRPRWRQMAQSCMICSSGDIFELKEDVTEVSYCDLKRAKSNSIFSRLIFANKRWFCFHGARFYDVGWRAGKKNVLAKRTKVDFGPYVNMENMISRHETDTVKNGSERTKIFFWPKLQGNLTPIYESRFSYQKCLYTLHKLSRSKFASWLGKAIVLSPKLFIFGLVSKISVRKSSQFLIHCELLVEN